MPGSSNAPWCLNWHAMYGAAAGHHGHELWLSVVPWGSLQAFQQRTSGFHIPRGWKLRNLSLPFLCPQPSRFKNMKLVGQAEVSRILSAGSALESARVLGSVLVSLIFFLPKHGADGPQCPPMCPVPTVLPTSS